MRGGFAVRRATPLAKEAALETSEQQNKRSVRGTLWDWAVALIIALVIAVVLTQVVFVNAQIPTESMEDTIMVGDRVLGLRLAYLFSEPARDDIIIFRFPDDETQLYVKRIIGMPGDEVAIADGLVYINGQAQPQLNDHVKPPATGDFGPWTVPADSYFVLGDNRSRSFDSRYWENTFVAENAIVGKAALRLFPSPGVLQ